MSKMLSAIDLKEQRKDTITLALFIRHTAFHYRSTVDRIYLKALESLAYVFFSTAEQRLMSAGL